MKPTDNEIQNQIDEAMENKNKFPAMTYAEGVEAALEWVLGNTDAKPMDD